jgi:hypothetical protein
MDGSNRWVENPRFPLHCICAKAPICYAFSQFGFSKPITKYFWQGSLCDRIAPVYHSSPNVHDEITR